VFGRWHLEDVVMFCQAAVGEAHPGRTARLAGLDQEITITVEGCALFPWSDRCGQRGKHAGSGDPSDAARRTRQARHQHGSSISEVRGTPEECQRAFDRVATQLVSRMRIWLSLPTIGGAIRR